MEYCILKNETANCSICSESHQIFTTIEPFKYHIIDKHIEIYQNNVIPGNNNWLWEYFYISKSQIAVCSICRNGFVPLPNLTSIKNHLIFIHYVNNAKAERLQRWIRLHVTELNTQKRKCNICENVYDENNSYNLMVHLICDHSLNPPSGVEIVEE